MPRCGNCQQDGQTVEHVRSCYAQRFATTTADVEVKGFAEKYVREWARPTARTTEVPASKYALGSGDDVKFFSVRRGKEGTKWAGFTFVDRLFGSPVDWRKEAVKGPERKGVLAALAEDPAGAAKRYAEEHGVCAVCGAKLSDPESRERGVGPKCWERFG